MIGIATEVGASTSHRQSGFALLDGLVGILLLGAALFPIANSITTSKRTTLTAQRQAIATAVAQKQLEALREIDYEKLVLGDSPVSSGDPEHPIDTSWIPFLRVGSDMGPFCPGSLCGYEVLAVNPGLTGAVDPGGPASSTGRFESGGDGNPDTTDAGAVTGTVYRYITWRDERCQPGVCDGVFNTKRLLVAVKLDPSSSTGIGPSKPVWLSSIIQDPGATGSFAPPDDTPYGDNTKNADLFYLYDEPCTASTWSEPTVAHDTTDTAASSANNADTSQCAVGARSRDWMGSGFPFSAPNEVAFDYSTDLGTGDEGLRLLRTGAYSGAAGASPDCQAAPTDYPYAATPAFDTLNKWNVHSWASQPLDSALQLTGRVALSLHMKSAAQTSGRAALCATLLETDATGNPSTAVALGRITVDRTVRASASGFEQFTISDTIPTATVDAGNRIVLVLTMSSLSTTDVELSYDHPSTPSHLYVTIAQ